MAMQLTVTQERAVRLIVAAIMDTIRESGPMGAPAGVLYAGLMTQGCTLSQFESLMGSLVRMGALRLEDDCYHAV